MTTEEFIRLDDAKLERLHARACKRCENGHSLNENSGPEDLVGLEPREDGGYTRSAYPCVACFLAEVKATRAKLPHPNHNRAPVPSRRRPRP